MSATKTLPEQITELQSQLTAKTTELATANQKVTDLTTQVTTLTEAKSKAEGDLKTEQTAHAATKQTLATKETELATANKNFGDATAKVTKLEGEAKTAQERAVEIAAAAGVTIPAASDANKGAGKDGKNSTTLTGIEAVEAMYREKYEGKK